MDSTAELRSPLAQAGWRFADLPPEFDTSACDGVFRSDYGWAGFLFPGDVSGALERWPDAQALMARIRATPEGRGKDLYLVFIFEMIPNLERTQLQRLADDTYVCRKIILEQGDRTLTECLSDVPLFAAARTAEHEETLPAPGGSTANLPTDLLDDLARHSADYVLNRLMEGQYGNRNESDDENHEP